MARKTQITDCSKKRIHRCSFAMFWSFQCLLWTCFLSTPKDVVAQCCSAGVCEDSPVPEKPESADGDPPGPEATRDPIFLRRGAVIETVTDIEIPGPLGTWQYTRTYSSQSGVRFALSSQGFGWLSNQTDRKLVEDAEDPLQFSLIVSASSRIIFKKQSELSPYYGVDTDLHIAHEASDHQFVITNSRTSEVWIFHDFSEEVDAVERGKLKETTETWWRGSEKVGYTYSYDEDGLLEQITTPEGQNYSIMFSYNSSDRIWRIDVKKGTTVLMRVGYAYATTYTTDIGEPGVLIWVRVAQLTSGGTNIDEPGDILQRYTQYRYYGTFLDAIFNNDGIFSLIEDNANINTPADILSKYNNYSTGSSSGKQVIDFADRLYTYYFENVNTNNVPTALVPSGENLEAKYTDETGHNTPETTFVKQGVDRPNGCASCGGGGSEGVTYDYYYMFISHGSTPDLNDVVLLVVEDVVNSEGQFDHRTVWGLNNMGEILRQVIIEDPGGTPRYWCSSRKFIEAGYGVTESHVGRVSEYRLHSAHEGAVTTANLYKFLDPSTDTNDSDTLNDSGVINHYTYDSYGRLQGTFIQNGEGGDKFFEKYVLYEVDPGTSEPTLSWAKWVYTYPTQVDSEDPYTGGIGTKYEYTFWDPTEKTRIKTRQIILPTVNSHQTSLWEYYDEQGRLRWTKNGEGYVTYRAYHPSLGYLAYQVRDVNTSSLPDGITNPTSGLWDDWIEESGNVPEDFTRGISGGSTLPAALNLVTIQEYDDLGRRTLRTNPGGDRHFARYDQTKTMVFPFISGSGVPTLPAQVTVYDEKLRNTETYSVKPSATTNNGTLPTGASTTQGDRVAWSRNNYDTVTGALTSVDVFHDIPTSGEALGINFYRTHILYDAMGRRAASAQFVEAGKYQVNTALFNIHGQPVETLRGVATDEPGEYEYSDLVAAVGTTPTPDDFDGYAITSIVEYDEGGVGDGHVTSVKSFFGTTVSTDYIKTIFHRTFRGHLRGIQRETSSSSDITPFTVLDVDWLGRTIASAQYTTEPTWSGFANDYAAYANDAAGSSGRNNLSVTEYDVLARVNSTESYPGEENSNHFVTNNYYDRRDNLVCTGDQYGAHTEIAYDGANRFYQSRTVLDVSGSFPYSSGEFQYCDPAPNPQIRDMSGGNEGVIELSHMEYYDNDADEPSMEILEEHQFELNHDDAGGLSLTDGVPSDGVRSTVYTWYDAADRPTAMANYGSGNGSSGDDVWESNSFPTYSSSPPDDSSAYVLLTEYTYDPATGRQETATGPGGQGTVTGPGGAATAVFYDDLGRRTFVAENFDDFDPGSLTTIGDGTDGTLDRVTAWAYNGLGQVITLTAYNGSSTNVQTTEYLYEDDFNASLVTLTAYPDGSTSGTDNVTTTYHLDGSPATRTDQREVEILYIYDAARRVAAQHTDGVTESGLLDESIQSIVRTYDDLGRVLTITSYENANGTGDVRNEIEYEYDDDIGRVAKVYQSHEGAVNTGTTPYVQYAYDGTVDSGVYENGLRLQTVSYPGGGRVVFNDYGTDDAIDDRLGRIKRIRETDISGAVLTEYSYNGASRLVITDYQQPDVKLDLYQGTPGSYAGYDRFGRTIHQQWVDDTPTVIDQFDYTYDYAGNRLLRDIPATLYAGNDRDQVYGYDALDRLKMFDEGTLSGGSISGTPAKEEDWTLDQLGNWANLLQKTGGSTTLNQGRTHNAVNEITEISGSPTNVAYDAAGNMSVMPQPASWASKYTLIYDAWNRLSAVYVPGAPPTLVASFEYDGLNRRIVRDVNGGSTFDYYYNEDWQLLEEHKDGEDDYPLSQYVWHPYYIDALAVRYWDENTDGDYLDTNEGAHYYLQDANFNVTAVTDDDGDVIERYAYTPYGEVTFLEPDFDVATTQESAIGNTHLYTGRERDPETGLQLNRNRYYSSTLGRWLTRDPIEYAGGDENLYAYAGGAPLSLQDPFGQSAADGKCPEPWEAPPVKGVTWQYGCYCGQEPNPPRQSIPKPIDPLDKCCKEHDECYGKAKAQCDKDKCDEDLCKCVKKVKDGVLCEGRQCFLAIDSIDTYFNCRK